MMILINSRYVRELENHGRIKTVGKACKIHRSSWSKSPTPYDSD